MNLREQGTDLHVSLALVLQHLQFQRRLCVVVEEVLNELTLEVFQTLFEADRAFIERAQLLVAQGHVVHGQKEDKLVIRVLGSLNLFQHSLCLLQQNQRFLKALLRNEIDGAFVEFIDYDWHLIFIQVQVLVVVFLKGVSVVFFLVGAHLVDHSDVTHLRLLRLFVLFSSKELILSIYRRVSTRSWRR